jgi:hypothetical protein
MTRRDAFRERADRAQAVTLNYTIGIAIATVLVTGLLIAGSSFVADQQEKATRSELRVIGQQTAASLETVDRLANTTEAGNTVRLDRQLPPNVAGSAYTIDLVKTKDPYLELTTENPDVEPDESDREHHRRRDRGLALSPGRVDHYRTG